MNNIVYYYMLLHQGEKMPTQVSLGKELGLHRHTIARKIKELKDAGMINIEDGYISIVKGDEKNGCK